MLLPYYTFNYLVSSGGEGSRSSLADNSLLVLLILIHYRKCVAVDESFAKHDVEHADSGTYSKGNSFFYDNPYCKALENARDVECKMYLLFACFIFLLSEHCYKLKKWICACSWSRWYWRECAEWSTCETAFCFLVWHSWNVSITHISYWFNF